MAQTHESEDWRTYVMDWTDPHRELEPRTREVAVVDAALRALVQAGVLPHAAYDLERMEAHRTAVRERFEIPWTAISPRVERLLYAVNAIARPRVMVAVGIFCGNTFVANAGAGLGPGRCYTAERLVGIEIRPAEADRARRNVDTLGADGRAEIVAADGGAWLRRFDGALDLLYLDADGPGGAGKSIYLDLLQAAEHALHPGSLVLAHNSVNAADQMADYLAAVRDSVRFRESVNVVLDDQGVEISTR